MKFRAGDTVIVTAGKEKGKTGKIARVIPDANKVVVENINIYVKHIKPMNGQEGRRLENPRPLPTANIAIVNNEGKPDRIGYKMKKDGTKERIFKKTGKVVPTTENAKRK
jgi:large subunit ribosomal protein L24